MFGSRLRMSEAAQAGLAAATRAAGRAEWVLWSQMLDAAERLDAKVDQRDDAFRRLAERSVIPLTIGQATGMSEGQVSSRLTAALRVRDSAPRTWAAFADGRVDGARVREISRAIDMLSLATSHERLDRVGLAYAETHTVAELRRWLRVFVARIESEAFNERAERERADRRVEIMHGDDGMSFLTLYGTSLACAAIDKRLTKEAKAFGADDARTMQQRRADLLAAWATTNEAGHAAVNADIAVTIQASTLAGADRAPAVAADGSWVAPAAWILELAKYDGNNIFWHRMILDRVNDDVLAHDYVGRFAPKVLAKALEFRDGVCQVAGCCRPASQCDLDHRIPSDKGGPTAGWNMGPYCRRHHKMKGFGLIDVGPTTTSPPGRSRNTSLHGVGMPDFNRFEHHAARFLFEQAA